jgi:hypothetical protein
VDPAARSLAGRRTAALALSVAALSLAATGTAHAASDATWDRLAQCESGGNWAINTGNSYYGGLQHSDRTWDAFRGKAGVDVHRADLASRSQQIAVAEHVLAAQGWGAWPACSKKLGLREGSTPRASGSVKVRPSAPAPAAKTPQRPSQGAPQGTYTVRRGDTLAEIAAAHGTTWRKLYANNRDVVENPNRIFPGERLDV